MADGTTGFALDAALTAAEPSGRLHDGVPPSGPGRAA
jgi:hypothetical protein